MPAALPPVRRAVPVVTKPLITKSMNCENGAPLATLMGMLISSAARVTATPAVGIGLVAKGCSSSWLRMK
jgi:hypothetical protein